MLVLFMNTNMFNRNDIILSTLFPNYGMLVFLKKKNLVALQTAICFLSQSNARLAKSG